VDWIQFAIMLITMAGMFAWLRADTAINRSEAAADRRDILTLIRAIHDEMRDFHGRMCTLEERYRKEK